MEIRESFINRILFSIRTRSLWVELFRSVLNNLTFVNESPYKQQLIEPVGSSKTLALKVSKDKLSFTQGYSTNTVTLANVTVLDSRHLLLNIDALPLLSSSNGVRSLCTILYKNGTLKRCHVLGCDHGLVTVDKDITVDLVKYVMFKYCNFYRLSNSASNEVTISSYLKEEIPYWFKGKINETNLSN